MILTLQEIAVLSIWLRIEINTRKDSVWKDLLQPIQQKLNIASYFMTVTRQALQTVLLEPILTSESLNFDYYEFFSGCWLQHGNNEGEKDD